MTTFASLLKHKSSGGDKNVMLVSINRPVSSELCGMIRSPRLTFAGNEYNSEWINGGLSKQLRHISGVPSDRTHRGDLRARAAGGYRHAKS